MKKSRKRILKFNFVEKNNLSTSSLSEWIEFKEKLLKEHGKSKRIKTAHFTLLIETESRLMKWFTKKREIYKIQIKKNGIRLQSIKIAKKLNISYSWHQKIGLEDLKRGITLYYKNLTQLN